ARPGRTPANLQMILDKALAKDIRNPYQRISYFAEDLRAVIKELGSESLPGFDDSVAPVTPQHLAPKNPMAGAFRWLPGGRPGDTGAFGVARGMKSGPSSEKDETQARRLCANDRKSVAILPFQNVGNDRDIDFYQ